MSETTLGCSRKLKEALDGLKIHKRETYEDIIWRLLKVKNNG